MASDSIEQFVGGAKRTDRKPRFDLIPFEFLESIADVLTEGAVKYGPCNWKRGKKDFFLDAWNHAFVHLQKFKEGDRSEDHLGHLACNVAFMVWAVKKGVVSQEDFEAPALNDSDGPAVSRPQPLNLRPSLSGFGRCPLFAPIYALFVRGSKGGDNDG